MKPWQRSSRVVIRVSKQDSAFVYFILESNEGLTAYSTLPHSEGDTWRDLELKIPPGNGDGVEELLQELSSTITIARL